MQACRIDDAIGEKQKQKKGHSNICGDILPTDRQTGPYQVVVLKMRAEFYAVCFAL